MKVYHGATSPRQLQKARETIPEVEHGYGWSPAKMTPHDDPYFLDNGAWPAYRRGNNWDPEPWLASIHKLKDMPRDPDFVVLPDKVGDADVTKARSYAWAQWLDKWEPDLTLAFAVQDGMETNVVEYARDACGADVIFVGGSDGWKRKNGPAYAHAAHDAGLHAHIARPDPSRLPEAVVADYDSMDSTTYARNDSLHRLRMLIEQATLEQSVSESV